MAIISEHIVTILTGCHLVLELPISCGIAEDDFSFLLWRNMIVNCTQTVCRYLY